MLHCLNAVLTPGSVNPDSIDVADKRLCEANGTTRLLVRIPCRIGQLK